MLLHITESLSLVLLAKEFAVKELGIRVEEYVLVSVSGFETNKSKGGMPCNLKQIYLFSEFISNTLLDNASKKVLVCVGSDEEIISRCLLLIGGYLILRGNKTVNDMFIMFENMIWRLQHHCRSGTTQYTNDLTVIDCWRALELAKSFHWINLENDEVDDECIDLEEYLHYDNPLNGSMHVIIPSKIIAFKCPTTLKEDVSLNSQSYDWTDVGNRRYFSPSFYAEILACDFNVKLIIQCEADIS
jgi:hypothetical protein